MKWRYPVILVGLFFVLMFINAGVTTYQTIRSLRSYETSSDPGWRAEPRRDRVVLYTVLRAGAAAGALRAGDEIVSINGIPQHNAFHVVRLFESIPAGSTYTVTVRRDGQLLEYALNTEPIPFSRAVLIPLAFLIPIIFLLAGFAIFLLKPGDKLALLLALMFGSVIGMSGTAALLVESRWLAVILTIAGSLSTFFFPIFLHFFLLFPDPKGSLSPLLRRFPRIEWYLYIPHLLTIFLYSLVAMIFLLQAPDRFNGLIKKYSWFPMVEMVAIVGYLVCGLISLLINYREASLPLRRKMRVVVAGSLAGLLPILLLTCLALFFSRERVTERHLLWLGVVALSAFPLFPLSFLYAIIRHQVIPVRVIIRRGIRYLFVRQGSILVELIVVAVVLTLLLNFIFTRMEMSHLAVGVISGMVSIVVWQLTQWLHHRVVAPAIDRAFFRQRYNAQQIFSELGQALRVISDWRIETLTLVSSKIQEALKTENATIFLRDEKTGDYPCLLSSHEANNGQMTVTSTPDLKLPRGAFVLQRLSESSRPLKVDFNDPKSWAFALASAENGGNQMLSQESETLKQINSALILPIATKDQLLGVISLGPRMGDLPFSREDQDLVKAVAAQLSFAIENSQLVRLKAEEERMRRELEFATEVQQRLFPQCPPQVAHLQLSGICYPARDVGGDYYDFLELENGQVGIAVADVSGKGISAALLMSVLQASLRAQARATTARMTDLISSMNRLLRESTDTSHYATFFYAQFDAESRRLSYVNAGHNPPILIRGSVNPPRSKSNLTNGKNESRMDLSPFSQTLASATISEETICLLTTGGPVIGLLEDCEYEYGSVELVSGDVLVAYTDGISEARNPEGEEFGEERLIQAVAENARLSADELRERIIDIVRCWQRDEPQHDDMTMVIMKVN